MGKIKVVRIISRLNIGGPAIHVALLNSALDPNRYESHLLTGAEQPGEASMSDYARSLGVVPVDIPQLVSEATLQPRDIQAVAHIYRLLRDIRPHIVHTHAAKAGFLGRVAARMARVPVVVHTYHGHILRGYYNPAITWALRRMERGLGWITNRLVAVSEQIRDDLIQLKVAPPAKITVVPLGLDLQPFLNSQRPSGHFRKEFGISVTERLVGIVGRLVPIKNHHLFLNSASMVIAEEPNARFVLVGDGLLRDELEQHAQQLGIRDKVVFTGWRRDLETIYADLDVLAVSSNNEGTPVCIIEAMAAGTPVVATRVGGIPDLIESGTSGYLVPPEEPQALSQAILRALRNKEDTAHLAKNARANVEGKFSYQRLVSDIDHLYSELLETKGISNNL